MSSKDTTNLSELCVCLGLAFIGSRQNPAIIESFVEEPGKTIEDLYKLADDMNIGLTNRDRTYRSENGAMLIKDSPNFDRIATRYIPTAERIANAVYQWQPPYPDEGVYMIAGGENKRLADGDPSDFIVDGEGFSLKDDSPGLFGGSTKHLLRFLSPEIIDYLENYEKAMADGKEFFQGKRIYSADGSKLRDNIGYDWHLAAEEKYRNKAYEMCLQSLLSCFIGIRRQIGIDAGREDFMLYNPSVPYEQLPEAYQAYSYSNMPSDFMIWDYGEDAYEPGGRLGYRIPPDTRRWLAHFQTLGSSGKPKNENLVIFDAYCPADYVEPYYDEDGECWVDSYDENPTPVTYLGIFEGNVSDVGRAGQLIIPLMEWDDEYNYTATQSQGWQFNVQAINANSYSADLSEYDPARDIEAILYSPATDAELYWKPNGQSACLDADIRKVLHHFADYGNTGGWPCPRFDGERQTADFWMRNSSAYWVDREYDEVISLHFKNKEFTEYDFWRQCVFYNSARKFSDELNARVGDIKHLNRDDELWFLRFVFRVYENSYYYVNMHAEDTDIMRVPSVAELEQNRVRIRDAIIPDGQLTVALRFFVNNEAQDECEINISIVSGNGTAVFTDSPMCKISYKKNKKTAGLATVYDLIHCPPPPEYIDQDLDKLG